MAEISQAVRALVDAALDQHYQNEESSRGFQFDAIDRVAEAVQFAVDGGWPIDSPEAPAGEREGTS